MRYLELFVSSSPAAVFVVALLKATLVLALVQCAVSVLPRLSAAAKHLLLSLALTAFLLIPLMSITLPRTTVALPIDVASAQAPLVAAPPAIDADSNGTPQTPVPRSVPSRSSVARPLNLSAWGVLAIIWLAGVLFLLGRLGIAALRLRYIIENASEPSDAVLSLVEETRQSMGVVAPVKTLVTDRVAVPMIWGVNAGTLLLPAQAEEWEREELRASIVHELGHLQRLDYVALGLMNLVTSLFWFHPQVWTARRRALTEGEHACDDLVLRSGARASEYASHLLSVARFMPRREPLSAILAMSRPTQLEGRMYAILSRSINRKAVGGKSLMMSAISFMLLVAPLATVQLAAQPPVEAATSATSWAETGTCADYNHDFDNATVVTGEQKFTVTGNHLDVNAAHNGGVAVRHATGTAFGVTVCKSAGGLSEAAARQILSQIDVTERAGKVSVNGPSDQEWVVDLIVTVPEGREISVTGSNGPISFRGVRGTMNASVVNGPLSFSDSQGDIKGKAESGPLALSRSSGNVDLTTSNGPLSIDLDGQAWVGGELRARVENGPLSLTLPNGYQTGISLSVARGPFECEGAICGGLGNRRARGAKPVNATLGTGPTRIYLQGAHGPVTVSQGD